MEINSFKSQLDKRPDLQHLLFRRSFFVSKEAIANINKFPFYGNWNHVERHGYNFYVHKDTHVYFAESKQCCVFLLGHSYNPFTMEWEEDKQLLRIAEAYGSNKFQDRIDELTGIFGIGWINLATGNIHFEADPSGMQSLYYGIMPNGNFILTSHPQIAADIYGLRISDFAKEIIAYKWYGRVMGPYLPADMSQYPEVKRVVPNIEYTFSIKDNKVSHHRFYPLKELSEVADEKEYNEVISQAAEVLGNGAKLVTKKWNNIGISLTGGIDSNTTFAAFNGEYDKVEAFSYLSAPKEVPDADAAKRIADHFRVKHTLFHIPDTNDSITDFSLKDAILEHTNGYMMQRKDNETRKRFYLEENLPFDVEVKSWVSETIRAYWYKHYGRNSMPRLSGKLFRNLYKIFLADRKLAHKIDKLFEQYITDFEYEKIPAQYPPADMHYNEVTWGSWGGMNISEMKFITDITIIYNNRKFLDLLFRIPLKDRISDRHHIEMKRVLNKELYDMNIRVVNMAETSNRARALNLIFNLNRILP